MPLGLATPPVTVVYKYYDQAGVLHLSNQLPKTADQLLYARSYLIYPENVIENKQLTHKKYADLIDRVAQQTYLPVALLHAIVQVESAYNAQAVSPKGAVGLMQLMPATAKRYGVADPKEPQANLLGGALYLQDLLALFKGSLELSLAAYNAGEQAVKRYGNVIPPYRETQRYVQKVLQLYNRYQRP